jgi:hypothetical protein
MNLFEEILRMARLVVFMLFVIAIIIIIRGEQKEEYTIKQCDKDYHQAVTYIEQGASERKWLGQECDDIIELDRDTGCFTLKCK